jgi:hypothetical protein
MNGSVVSGSGPAFEAKQFRIPKLPEPLQINVFKHGRVLLSRYRILRSFFPGKFFSSVRKIHWKKLRQCCLRDERIRIRHQNITDQCLGNRCLSYHLIKILGSTLFQFNWRGREDLIVSFFKKKKFLVFFLPNLDEMKRGPGDENTKLIGKLVPPVHKFRPLVTFLLKCHPMGVLFS